MNILIKLSENNVLTSTEKNLCVSKKYSKYILRRASCALIGFNIAYEIYL